MVIFTSKFVDIAPWVKLFEYRGKSDITTATRRITRYPTLDGDVAMDDAGYSEGDRELLFRVPNISEVDKDAILRLQRLYGTQRCSIPEGIFEGSIYSITVREGLATIRFWPQEKLSS